MFQFVHIESYSRVTPKKGKRGAHNVSSIVNEAARLQGAIPHISDPCSPTYLYGDPLEELSVTCDNWCDSVTDAKGKKTRKDALCLIAGVVSAPNSIGEVEWGKLRSDSVEWLKNRYGKRLRTIVEHTDEANPHIHFFVVPLHGERFDQVHDGKRAAAANRGKKKGDQNIAYKMAMRDFLDDYSRDVGVPNALLRFGPRRRRLSRADWKIEQSQAKSISMALARSQEAEILAIQKAENILKKANSRVSSLEKAAVMRGEKKAITQFEKRSLFGKCMAFISGLSKENKKLRTDKDCLAGENASWKRKATAHQVKLNKCLNSIKLIEPRYREMENLVKRTAVELEQIKVRETNALQELSRVKYSAEADRVYIESLKEEERAEQELVELATKLRHKKKSSVTLGLSFD